MSAGFPGPGPAPGCLSGWRLSRAVSDSLDAAERAAVDSHLAGCARCRERFEAERAEFEQAQHEPMPDFAARSTPVNPVSTVGRPASAIRPSRRAWLAAGTVLALAAGAFLVTRPPPEVKAPPGLTSPIGQPGGERGKGGAPRIEVAIERAGVVMAEPVAIDQAVLQAGDRLRLKVARTAGLNVAVEAFDAGQWAEIERGVIPEDGWLPLVLSVTAGDPARLRVLACVGALPPVAPPAASPTLAASSDCRLVEHTFEVR